MCGLGGLGITMTIVSLAEQTVSATSLPTLVTKTHEHVSMKKSKQPIVSHGPLTNTPMVLPLVLWFLL